MKKILFFSACVCVCGLATSCQKDELFYSCDEEINSFVKQNLADISTMTTKEWQELNHLEYQRGVYGAFSQKQRIALWEDKFVKVLDLNWIPEEEAHITKLLEFVKQNPDLFLNNDEIDDKRSIEIYRWIEYAKEVLHWEQDMIYSICMTPELLNKDKKIIANTFSSNVIKARSESGYIKTCNCSLDASALLFTDCRKDNCHQTTAGCAPLWSYPCTGVKYE